MLCKCVGRIDMFEQKMSLRVTSFIFFPSNYLSSNLRKIIRQWEKVSLSVVQIFFNNLKVKKKVKNIIVSDVFSKRHRKLGAAGYIFIISI
jgi:hypothetical protein